MTVDNWWNGRRVLITGATGLLGSAMAADLLRRGAQVTALVRDHDPQSELIRSGIIRKVTVVQGALEDYASVERAINENDCETVFHLGAQTIVGTALRSPLATFEANIRGTYHVLEACRTHQKLVQRIVIASSDKAYGSSDILPYTEKHPLSGRHPYDVSKSCTDMLAAAYAHTYQLPVGILRCGNIYGGGDLNWSRIVPGTIRSLLENKAPIIRSDGKFLRDYIYVQDVVDAYLLFARRLEEPGMPGEALNISPEKASSVLDIVDLIREIMGRTSIEPVILNQASAEIRDQYLDCQRAKTVLGWRPKYTLQQGLEATVSWYEDYLR
ncbi:MAG: GDP-mannose 4,6-dehydratase [Bryobacterales bacterium]|nr:GDP-mannose 4,6-dehydratase [Bryobacterales bacterium]